MIRRIILENFMSHARTEIELADGLTVLTGPNNCGKSAVVAALQILATNGRTTHVTRHGAKECRVTVETDDGHIVVWERKKKVVKYSIDGEDVHRVGLSIPESLHEKLRLDRVSAEAGASKFEYDIHFGEQKSPVFLLNESGSRAASFFASSSDASRLVEMQHLHRSRVRDKKAEATRLKSELEKTEVRLKHFDAIDSLAERMSLAEITQQKFSFSEGEAKRIRETVEALRRSDKEARRLYQQLRTLQRLDQATTNPTDLEAADRTLMRLKSIVQQKLTLIARQHQHREQVRFLSQLDVPPPQHDVERLEGLTKQLASTGASKRATTAVVSALAELQPTPVLEETKPLQSLVAKLVVAAERRQDVEQTHARLKPLREPPAVEPVERLQRCVSELQQYQRRARGYTSLVKSLSVMTPPVEPMKCDAIEAMMTKLVAMSKQVLVAKKLADVQRKHLAQCESDIRRYVEENPKCTACGASIDPETLISSVPSLHEHAVSEENR